MRRLYLFFVCMCVLAACSTLKFNGEQTARTVSHAVEVDSTYYQRMLERTMSEYLQKWMHVQEWIQQTTVTERLSAPDSTGKQHVTERTTTTLSKNTDTSAGSSNKKDEQYQEKVDSTDTRSSDNLEIQEEKKEVSNQVKKKGFMPWYVYVVSLVGALVVGFVSGLIIKKRAISCR